MSDFNTVEVNKKPLDPHRRVKYSMGLVLGVDEFEQEQLYLMERDRLHNRALHGYGTVSGLKVTVEDNAGNPQLMVSAGLAVNPAGESICVPQNQCALLKEWLAQNQDKIVTHVPSSPPPAEMTVPVYLVLCYRQCETDFVPVPGAPCRTQEDSMAASRIADHFELSLQMEPPEQLEEEVVDRFGQLLQRIEITAESRPYLDKKQMEELVWGLYPGLGSPPSSSPSSPPSSSPPLEEGKLYLSVENAAGILQWAFRVWVTDVRPALVRKGTICGQAPDQSCVLLAQLGLTLHQAGGGWTLKGDAEAAVSIKEEERPYLLHTRMLQEWLLCAHVNAVKEAPPPRTFSTVSVLNSSTLRVWVHHPVLLDIPPGAVEMAYRDGSFKGAPEAVTQPVAGVNVFDLEFDLVFNHDEPVTVTFDAAGITENGSPSQMLTDALAEARYHYLDRDGDTIYCYLTLYFPALNDLSDVAAPSPKKNQFLKWDIATEKWLPATPDHGSLGGLTHDDHRHYLTKARGDNYYAKKNHVHSFFDLDNVSKQDPGNGDCVLWNAAEKEWRYGQITGGGTEEFPLLLFVTIEPVTPVEGDVITFRLWFHPEHGDIRGVRMREFKNLNIFREVINDAENCSLLKIEYDELRQDERYCNCFFLNINAEELMSDRESYLRFHFALDAMSIEPFEGCNDLFEWSQHRKLKWVGYDGEATVTSFYHFRGEDVQRRGSEVVAAGTFYHQRRNNWLIFVRLGANFGGLSAKSVNNGSTVLLGFLDYHVTRRARYIVKATPIIKDEQPLAPIAVLSSINQNGIIIDLAPGDYNIPYGFMVEITRIY